MSSHDEYLKYLQSLEWKVIRQRMLDHVGNKCQRCGRSGPKLEVHHKSYTNLGHEVIPEDLEVLCRDCHEGTHVYMRHQRGLDTWATKKYGKYWDENPYMVERCEQEFNRWLERKQFEN